MTPEPSANQTAGQTGEPALDDFTRTFLRLAIIAIIGCGLTFIAVILIFTPDQTGRIANPVAGIGIASLSLLLLRKGHTRAGLLVVTYGTWAAVTGIAISSGGVGTPVVFCLPVVIFFSGWLLGTRTAIIVTSLSIIGFLMIAVAEYLGMLPPVPTTPPFMHWVVQATINIIAAAAIIHLRNSHALQVEEVRTLTAELARQRAEAIAAESLRLSQDLLDRTGRLARVGGWEIDVATGTLSWTAESFRLHDLEPGSMPSIDQAVAFYSPEVRQVVEAALAEAINEGTPYDLELPLITAKGRQIWVRALGVPQFEGGRVVRVSGAFQDISEQRRSAEALKQSLNNLQLTLEATGDGIFGYDGNDPSGKLLFANDRFFEIWNIPPQDAPTTGRPEIIAAARKLFIDPDEGVRRIGEILAMQTVHEDTVPLNDGRILLRRSIPLLDGSQVSRVWSFRDITAEERSKAELQASRDEAQRANAAKSDFLSRMSHELRTPMHAIMGMMALARRRMQDPQGLDQLDKSKAAADHLLSVINDILDISKIEAGRLELEQVDFRLDDVLRNLVNLVGNRAREKGLTLLIDKDLEGADASLRGDSLRLGQIMLNIISNAIKFSQHGTIIIRVRRERTAIDDILLRFEIQDEGIGIDAEKQDRLFLAFEQADGSMTRKFGGTGLGLAISKRLVQMMGGDIGVVSRAGEGSTFWFTAWFGNAGPTAALPSGSAESAEHRLQRDFAGARILLADDEPIGREVIQELLGVTGLRIELAEDGAEALQKARAQHFDVILMDMQMPTMNGVDATRAIRAGSMNHETPIIAMTANAFEEDRRVCLAAGMNDHIGKPVAAELLFLTLLRWLMPPRS